MSKLKNRIKSKLQEVDVAGKIAADAEEFALANPDIDTEEAKEIFYNYLGGGDVEGGEVSEGEVNEVFGGDNVVQYDSERSGEDPFVMNGVKWQYVNAIYPNGKKDIAVYRFDHDLAYDYEWFRKTFIDRDYESHVDEVNQEVMSSMEDQYGKKRGKDIYYATANKQNRDPETFELDEVRPKGPRPRLQQQQNPEYTGPDPSIDPRTGSKRIIPKQPSQAEIEKGAQDWYDSHKKGGPKVIPKQPSQAEIEKGAQDWYDSHKKPKRARMQQLGNDGKPLEEMDDMQSDESRQDLLRTLSSDVDQKMGGENPELADKIKEKIYWAIEDAYDELRRSGLHETGDDHELDTRKVKHGIEPESGIDYEELDSIIGQLNHTPSETPQGEEGTNELPFESVNPRMTIKELRETIKGHGKPKVVKTIKVKNIRK